MAAKGGRINFMFLAPPPPTWQLNQLLLSHAMICLLWIEFKVNYATSNETLYKQAFINTTSSRGRLVSSIYPDDFYVNSDQILLYVLYWLINVGLTH